MSTLVNFYSLFGRPNKTRPSPFWIGFKAGGKEYFIQCADPRTIQIPIEEKPLDLPLGSIPIVVGERNLGSNSRNLAWNVFGLGGYAFKLQVRGGFSFPSKNGFIASAKILFSNARLIPWYIEKKATGQFSVFTFVGGVRMYWSVKKDLNSPARALVLQKWDTTSATYIQSFDFIGPDFDIVNDPRPD
ncbi:hypothetical protein TWF694_007814 [Orbilia ellipsospora]|uniref:Uncharacterized protein n=1 Tax=Orbilia ellipsospora TaxID=2528407 RepID=A0AAV9XIY3_9PEZI